MQRHSQRVRTVERKLMVGTICVFFFLGAYFFGGSVVVAALLLAAISAGCGLRPVAERIVARDLSLYSLLDPTQDTEAPRLSGSRLRQLERYAYQDRDDGQDA